MSGPLNKKIKRLSLAIGLSIFSFIILQISVIIYPGDYAFFGNTISTLSAIVVNGQTNYYSAITLPLSHFCLATGIALFSATSHDYYLEQAPGYINLVKLINAITLLGCASIIIAAITPHGTPEPFGKVHRFFGVLMFAIFAISALLLISFNFLHKGIQATQTFVPLVFFITCVLLIPLIYFMVELQWLPNSRLIPSFQKFGYYLFIIAITTQMILLYLEFIKKHKSEKC